MTVVVALEHRFIRVGDTVYSNSVDYERFWKRYLAVFDDVKVFARVHEVNEVLVDYKQATGPGVSFLDVPYYHGPWQYLKVHSKLKRAAKAAVSQGDIFILRVPGQLGSLLWRELRCKGLGCGVEVVGDPWDVYAPGGVKVPLQALVRRIATLDLKRQCKSAVAAHYVTKSALQKRYPCHGKSFHSSDVTLNGNDFSDNSALQARIDRYRQTTEWNLIHIGSMDQTYKRQELLIEAVAILRQQGFSVSLTLVGDGKLADGFRRWAAELGIAAYVNFCGKLPGGKPIFDALDKADLFVLPSQTEGLPRVIIEAMARGVPCLASDVGGLNELLPAEDLFPVTITAQQLADRIAKALADKQWLVDRVERGWRTAQEYESSKLQAEREKFYRVLLAAAEKNN